MKEVSKIFITNTIFKKRGLKAILKLKSGERVEIEDDGLYPTENRTEIYLIIRALKLFKPGSTVYVYCNSTYVTNMFNKKWIDKWQQNGWVNQRNETIKNLDLIQELLDLTNKLYITFYEPLPVYGAFDALYE